jgi:hypothetical protein
VLQCEHVHADTYCHVRVLHSMSAFQAFSSQLSSLQFLVSQYKTWQNSQAADFFDKGIQQLISQCNNASIPAMTTLRSSLSMCILFLVYDTLSSHCLFCYQPTGGNFPNSTHTLSVGNHFFHIFILHPCFHFLYLSYLFMPFLPVFLKTGI